MSPVFTGSAACASTPSGETVALSTLEADVRVATATGACAPDSAAQERSTELCKRATNWSFGIGMKSRSLAPARKQSSR